MAFSFRKDVEFYNAYDVQMFANQVFDEANNDTALEMLDKLKEIIETNVYDAYEPMNYERTYQFVDAWSVKRREIPINNESLYDIYFDKRKIHINKSKNQHTYVPIENLPMIIETGNGYLFSDVQERPFWEEFQRYVRSQWTKRFKANCRRRGLPID